MTALEMFAQIIGIIGMIVTILSYQCKSRKWAIAMLMTGSFLFVINFYLLGALVGAILNLIVVLRSIVYYDRKKFKADSLIWLIVFIIAYISTYILNFFVFGKELTIRNAIVEVLPIIGMIASNLGLRCNSAKGIRRFGLLSSPAWLIYNIASGSIGAMLCEVFSFISIIVGIIRLDIKKGVDSNVL